MPSYLRGEIHSSAVGEGSRGGKEHIETTSHTIPPHRPPEGVDWAGPQRRSVKIFPGKHKDIGT